MSSDYRQGRPPRRFIGVGVVLTLALSAGSAGCADLERGEPLSADAHVGPSDAGAEADAGPGDGSTAGRSFARDVHPLLVDGCARCHGPGGQAADSALVLGVDAARDRQMVVELINPDNPAASRLLSKGAGTGHGGGAIYAPGTPEYQTILEWITQGSAP